MSKNKNTSQKSISKSALTGRFIKSPAKSGSIVMNQVDKAVKKVASRRNDGITKPHS